MILANILGVVSAVIYWASYFRKDKKKIVGMYVACDVADFLQYFLLRSPTAMVDAGVVFFRDLAFTKSKGAKLTVLFGVLKCIGILALGFEGTISVAAVVLEVFGLITLIYLSEQWLRLHGILIAVYWIFYDTTHGAFVTAALGVGSVIAGVIAIYKNKKKQTERRGT